MSTPRATLMVTACRPDMLAKLLESWNARPWADEYDMVAVLQDFNGAQRREAEHLIGGKARAIYGVSRRAPYLARALAYERHPEVETWVLLDDDMEFTDETNFAPAIAAVHRPGVGIVSCNWVRTESPALRARAKFEPTLVPQPIVYTAGGMVFARRIRDVLLEYPVKPWAFDDVHTSLCAYLEGYVNYRYLGSLLIHRTVHKGGLVQTYRARPMEPPLPGMFNLTALERPLCDEGGAQNYAIPGSAQLTELARHTHLKARTRLLNGVCPDCGGSAGHWGACEKSA